MMKIINSLFLLSLTFTGCGEYISSADENTTVKEKQVEVIETIKSLEENKTVEIPKTDDNETDITATVIDDENITFPTITYYDSNISSEKKFQVITNQNDLEKLYKSIDFNDTQTIDFTENYVLSLSLGKRLSNDYTIKVLDTSIIKYDNDYSYLNVSIQTTIVDDNCIENREEVTPLTFVTIPKHKYEDILFEESIKFVNCNDENLSEEFHSVDFRKIPISDKGYSSDKIIEVVKDDKTYNSLCDNFCNKIDNKYSYIDFENEILIFAYMRIYGSGGYDIKVTSVNEYNNYIEVNLESSYPDANGDVTENITYPTTFVAIPKTDKEIIFKESFHVEYCEDE